MYLVDFGSAASRSYAISRGSGNSFTAKEIESPEVISFLKSYRKERFVIQSPTDIIMQRNRRRANVIFYKHRHKWYNGPEIIWKDARDAPKIAGKTKDAHQRIPPEVQARRARSHRYYLVKPFAAPALSGTDRHNLGEKGQKLCCSGKRRQQA